MSQPPRYLWRIVFTNFINSFKSRASPEKFMGEDVLGNKYFESIPTKASHRTKPRRWFKSIHGEEGGLEEVPTEWEAWLRGRRKIPPSPEEIAKNTAIMLMKKENAKQLELERLTAKASPSPEESKMIEASKLLLTSKPGEASKFPDYGNEFETGPGSLHSKKELK